ncbi:MAG TPA: type IV pilus assembly protein PilM [Solirubrobacteraceae bacterium]|nr:type IV pilus assembly protein PilM [Solirubrobacteraceae bacterium]
MAKSSKTIVGLDIDPSGVTAAQVAVNGHVLIEAAATAPLEAGVVRDGEVEDVEALAEVLRGLFREHRDLDKRVRVGIANSKIVVRVIDLPPIADPKELEAAVRFQAQEHIPMPLDSAVLDFQPLELVETEGGPRQRVLLVAARRDMIDRVLAAVRGAGLRVEGVDLAAFAMVRALYRKGDAEERVLYLSVAGMTNLAMAQGSTCLFTRSSGGGLESLAVELAERRALTLEHARAWLVHVGLDRPVELIDGEEDIVTEAREVLVEGVRRIASEVRASLDFHHAQGGGGVMSRVVLTGPAIAVPGFAEALGIELGLPVEAGHLAGGPDDLEPGRLTVAAGLAIEEAPHS